MRTLYDTVLQSSVDLQYESILDDNVVTGSMDVPLLKDQYKITNITIENDDWSDVKIPDYFNYRSLKSYCNKQGYKLNTRVWSAPAIAEFVAIFETVPVLGYEQNIVSELRRFVRPGSDVILEKNHSINKNNSHITIIVKAPVTKKLPNLEIGIYLHKRK